MNRRQGKVREVSAQYRVALAEAADVPVGYKRTEVGVIPEDWEYGPLGKFISLQRGFDLPHRLRREGDVPIVSSSGTSGTHSHAKVSAPGIVTGRYGTIGDVFYILEDFWPLNTTLYVKDFKGNNPLFVSHILKTIDFKSHSGKSGVPGVNRNDLHQLEVCFPALHEQHAIATALSDVDALIAALDKLITKKRAIKTAAMQQLLTGKQRLPGFTGEWEVKRLGEVLARVVGGGTPSRSNPDYWGGAIPWATVKDFTTFDPLKTQETITEPGLANSASNLIPAGTLIISTRMAIGKAVIYEVPVSINQDLKALFCKPFLSEKYLYYWFEHNADMIDDLGGGSTVKGLAVSSLKAIRFELPTIEEQNSIAQILSDMDAEITALEKRRAKTRAIKQGMMQELLTGRTRLV